MSNAKTWKLTVNEDELKAIIHHHALKVLTAIDNQNWPDPETSARIHDLTKRLNKAEPEIENAEQVQPKEPPVAPEAPKTGW